MAKDQRLRDRHRRRREKARAFYVGLFDDWSFETGPSGDGFVVGTGGVPGGIHTGDAGSPMYAFFEVPDTWPR